MSSCSPQFNSNKDSCYTLKDLQEITKNYNKSLKNGKKIKVNQSKEKLYNSLIKANYNKCGDNEYCWLKQNYMLINKDVNKFLEKFRPERPNTWEDNPKQWLNTYNLVNVMTQYEKKYKNFKFLGVHPIDFAFKINNSTCISQNMCDLNINNLIKNKIYKIGNIFNLDKHYQSGSHWVSLFANINPKSKNYGIFYYDSNGNGAPAEVKNFASKLINDNLKLSNKKLKFYQNNIKHQFKNSECGIFSLHFIDQSLKNISFDKFINNKNLTDESMFKLRNKFFNKKN
jgi:hypothetical protein